VTCGCAGVCGSEVVWGGKDAIQNAVRRWCDNDVALLLTAGGEGFEVEHCVPEAVSVLLDRLAPGMLTVMLDALHAVRVEPTQRILRSSHRLL
jgi:molybdopterin biosynthesis enzyme MoaB